MLNILSLGAGVQSTTVYHRSGVGELPKLDCAIFADTGWEPKEVYAHLDELIRVYAPKYGIPIHVVKKGDLRSDALRSQVRGKKSEGQRCASMPLRTKGPDGKSGMIKRQCTAEYKIEPIERFIKTQILGLKKRARWPKEPVVRQWFGISFDESRRMRQPVRRSRKKVASRRNLFDPEVEPIYVTVNSPITWKTHFYPLIGLELTGEKGHQPHDLAPMNRKECEEWLAANGFGTAPRSACIGCPYRSNAEWRHIRENPEEWQDAVEFDQAIRRWGGMRGETFLHRDLVPLDEADIDETPDDDEDLFGCMDGVCGV